MAQDRSPSPTSKEGARDEAEEPSTLRRALATGASVVPGVLLHGTGHVALGEYRTGLALMGAQGAGLALLLGGISGLAVTGAADEFIPPLYWTAMTGAGLFFFSWGADLYGTLGASRWTGRAYQPTLWSVSQGYRHVISPASSTTSLSRTKLSFQLHKLHLEGIFFADLRGLQDQRFEARARYLLLGSFAPDPLARWLEVGAGLTRHRYNVASTTESLGELFLYGRHDLRRFSETLAGLFVDASIGVAMGQYHYAAVEARQFEDLLLGTAGLGLYLGDPDDQERRGGTFQIFYDHRHDGHIGGTKMRGLGSGAIGSLNVRLEKRLSKRFAIELGYGVGSAHVMDAAFSVRSIEEEEREPTP